MAYATIFIFGLVFGSFMSVIVARLDNRSGIIAGRSECPECSARLRWYDLIPLLSFVYLWGRCRYCKTKISLVYPAIEVVTAFSFLGYYWMNSPSLGLEMLLGLGIIFVLIALAFFDFLHYILPDKLIVAGVILAFFSLIFFENRIILSSLFTGLGLMAFFAIIYLISHGEWMGLGDVKLAFLIGLVLGYPLAVFSIIGATWIGALWGLAMIGLNRASLKTELPFGVFINSVALILIIFHNYAKLLIGTI